MKDHRAQTPTATKHGYTTGKSTEAMDRSTAKPGKVTEENIPVTSPSEAPLTTKTTVSIATTLAAIKPTNVPPSSSTVGLRTSPPATGNVYNGSHQWWGQEQAGQECLGPALRVFKELCVHVCMTSLLSAEFEGNNSVSMLVFLS